jgi:dTMP kinase
VKGVFISFEGIEGTGKSTQTHLLAGYLRRKGLHVVETAEPGGTPISLKIRELLLSVDNKDMDAVTELLLYNAARVQHIRRVILPALERGDIVVTDRFSDSTTAYQGYGRGINLELIETLDLISTGRMRADITILLDVDVTTGLKRNRKANKSDRLELEDISFHERVRKGFIAIASKEKKRVKLIACSDGVDTVHDRVIEIIEAFLKARNILQAAAE